MLVVYLFIQFDEDEDEYEYGGNEREMDSFGGLE